MGCGEGDSYEFNNKTKGFLWDWSSWKGYGLYVRIQLPVILLQYGHGTKDGGYIVGRNFINPVMKPIFDRLGEEMWREVHRI